MNPQTLVSLLLHTALFCGLILLCGTLALRLLKEPADQLGLIPWILTACLVSPLFAAFSTGEYLSLNLLPHASPSTRIQTADLALKTQSTPPDTQSIPAPIPERIATHSAMIALPAETPTPEVHAAPSPSRTISPAAEEEGARLGFFNAFTWQTLLLVAYFISLLALALWGMLGFARLLILRRSARTAPESLQQTLKHLQADPKRHIRLLVSDRTPGPITWGYFRPVILIPTRMLQSTDESALRWSLAHELSHVERRDFLTLLLATASQFICFYQPLYWSLRRHLILCQDFLADARAASQADSTEDYAQFLVALAGSRSNPPLPLTLGIGDRPSQLSRRVRMLLSADGRLNLRCRNRIALVGFCGSLLLLAILGGIRLDAEESPQSATPVTQASPSRPPAQPPSPPSETPPAAVASTQPELPPIDPAQLEQGVVSGTLLNAADGSPVSGALVIMHTGGSTKTTTDEHGHFRLEQIKPRGYPYKLWAHKENLISEVIEIKHLSSPDPNTAKFAPVTLKMIPGNKARFHVTSKATGKPLADADVRLGYPDRRLVKTDAEGIATMEGLLSKGPFGHDITVEAVGYARHAVEIELPASREFTDFQISLDPGAVLEGTILDENDQPLEEAEVTYHINNASGFHGDDFRTGPEGRFRSRFLPLNVPIEIFVRKSGYELMRQQIVLSDPTTPRQLQIRLKKLPSGKTVHGLVTDPSGIPLPDVHMATTAGSTGKPQQTKTDPQGKFTLSDVPAGDVFNHRIFLKAPGFAPQGISFEASSDNKPINLTIQMKPPHTVRGIIELEDATSPEGATVAVVSANFQDYFGHILAVGPDGKFEFNSLPEDVAFQIQKDGYASLINIPLLLDTPEPVNVFLSAPAQIRGRVVDDETGRPLSQFRIQVNRSLDSRGGDPLANLPSDWYEPGKNVSSEFGEFSIGPCNDRAAYSLIVEQPGYETQVVRRAVATKNADETSSIEIRLKKSTTTANSSLKGVILDHTGNPVSGAQLRLIVSTTPPLTADDNSYNWSLIENGQLGKKYYCEQFLAGTTDSQGRFQFEQIRSGKYLQLAYWGNGVPRAKSLAFDKTHPETGQEITIKVPQPAAIRGRLDRQKFPEAGSVQVTRNRMNFDYLKVDLHADQETFQFETLSPGKYSVTLYSKLVPYTEKGVRLASSSPLSIQEIELQPGQTLDLQFLEPISK